LRHDKRPAGNRDAVIANRQQCAVHNPNQIERNDRPKGRTRDKRRLRRRLIQLDLACEANVSPRHLSFVETGRARPSRDMLLQLADYLDIPLRERNLLARGGWLRCLPAWMAHCWRPRSTCCC
jgi:DNA-binding XRE family transcriptional regulator